MELKVGDDDANACRARRGLACKSCQMFRNWVCLLCDRVKGVSLIDTRACRRTGRGTYAIEDESPQSPLSSWKKQTITNVMRDGSLFYHGLHLSLPTTQLGPLRTHPTGHPSYTQNTNTNVCLSAVRVVRASSTYCIFVLSPPNPLPLGGRRQTGVR